MKPTITFTPTRPAPKPVDLPPAPKLSKPTMILAPKPQTKPPLFTIIV